MWCTCLSLSFAFSLSFSLSLFLSLSLTHTHTHTHTHTQTAEMDGQYAAFGKVVSGIDLRYRAPRGSFEVKQAGVAVRGLFFLLPGRQKARLRLAGLRPALLAPGH
jgi:hypothetical protein